jgi:adiponectin receptor
LKRVSNTCTKGSMASHRKHVIFTTKAVNTRGFFGQRDGHSVRNIHQTPRKQPMLIAYEELPAWYQDNKHILQGYRPESLSMSACFMSWTYLHNETFNIYSHLIPAIIFMFAQVFILCLLPQTFPDAKPLDYVAFSCFLLSACITLSISFLYHTLMNHSMGVSYFLLRLDYVGILALTLGDFVSGIRVGFYCHPSLQKIYWSMVGPSKSIPCSTALHRFVSLYID